MIDEKTGGKILGKVVDSSTGRLIEYATTSLFRIGKSSPLNETTTDSRDEDLSTSKATVTTIEESALVNFTRCSNEHSRTRYK
jgi:hypothetical protein